MSALGLAVRFGGRRDHVIDDIHSALDALEAGRSHRVQWYSVKPQQPAPTPTTQDLVDSDSESDDCAWTTEHLDSCLGPGTQDMTVRFCEMDIVLSQSLGEVSLAVFLSMLMCWLVLTEPVSSIVRRELDCLTGASRANALIVHSLIEHLEMM